MKKALLWDLQINKIAKDKYQDCLNAKYNIYQITIEKPSPTFLVNPKQIEDFSYEYRQLLNQIQAKHGRNCEIGLLPAVPAAIAVECGRALLPNKDPEIWVWENEIDSRFVPVLKINR